MMDDGPAKRQLSPRLIISMIWRRKLIVLGFFICALAGGYVGLKVISPVYRSSAQVMVNLGQDDVFMPVLPSSSSEVRQPLSVGRLEQRATSEARIIESEPLAAALVAKFGPDGLFPGINERHPWYTPKGLMQHAIALYRALGTYFYPQTANETLAERAQRRISKAIKTTVVKDSTVIEVSMDNSVPQIAADSLNELLRLYLQQRVALYKRDNDAFFDRQIAKQLTDLKAIDQQLEEFRASNAVVDVDQQREALLRRISEVTANLQNDTVAIGELKRRIALLQGQMNDNVGIAARIRIDLLAAQAALGPRQESAASWAKIRDELTAKAEALSGLHGQSSQLLQQQRVLLDNRRLYLQKLEETRVQQALRQAQMGDVVVINWAAPDHSPISPKLPMVLGGVIGIGLVGGIMLAIALGLMDDRIRSEDDVADAAGLPVIGRVSALKLAEARSI